MRRFPLFLLLCFHTALFAQWRDSLPDRIAAEAVLRLEDALEKYAESDDGEWDVSGYQEALEALRANPVNLHLADDACLGELLGLTEYQRYQLRRYIYLHGYIQSPLELAAVDGFSAETVQGILPYVSFGKPLELEKHVKRRISEGRSDFLLRWGRVLAPQHGMRTVPDSLRNAHPGGYYEGSPDALLLKYSYRCADWFRIGLVAEKDAGEAFLRGSNPWGFDYYSCFVQYKGKGWLQNLIAGDYQLQFGQALAMGMGFRLSSSDPDALCLSPYGLKPHTSANESQFFRGVALAFRLASRTEASLFVSSRRTDALCDDSLFTVSSISGYHRTLTETVREKTVRERVGGLYLSRNGRSLHVGAGWYALSYAVPLGGEPKPYGSFRFRGSSLWNGSVDFVYNLHRTAFFGEASLCGNGSGAFSGGLLYDADDRLRLSMLVNLLPKDYQAIPDLLSGSYNRMNERGLQVQGRMLLGKNGTLDASVGKSCYPWLKYRADAPSQASSVRMRYSLKDIAGGNWLFMYGWRQTEHNVTEVALRVLEQEVRHSSRVRWEWNLPSDCRFRLQWDGVLFVSDAQRAAGSMWTQQFTFGQRRLRSQLSFSCFDTDSYQGAIYTSESDVLYASSASVCSGKGIRCYGLVSFRCTSHWSMYAKLSFFRYYDRDVVGSGAAQTDAPHRTECRVQIVWKG